MEKDDCRDSKSSKERKGGGHADVCPDTWLNINKIIKGDD